MESLSLRICVFFYCKLYFVLSISAYNECNKRGQTSRPVVRVEIQTSCNFMANICDGSNLLGYVSYCLVTAPFKSPYTHLVRLYNYSFISSNLNYFLHKDFLKVRHRRTQVQRHAQQEQPSQPAPLNIEGYKKVVTSALWVQCALVVCYLPYCIVRASISYKKTRPSAVFLMGVASTLIFFNSSLNPFLYCWKISEVKQAVKETIREALCC